MTLIPIIIISMLMLCVTSSKWLEFDDIGYPFYRQLDLSGGVDSNEYKYIAPNNTAVVESSAQRVQNSNYHYLSNLFDTSLYYTTIGNTHHHSYWLGSCSSTETETITITFSKLQDLSHIIVSARTLLTDRFSWYAIDAYVDAIDFKNGDAIKAVHITQMVNTNDDYFGEVHVHSVKGKYELLVFYITKPTSYCALNEIKIFVMDPTHSPTACPTSVPTTNPTAKPTRPSENPTTMPTSNPTINPTQNPTENPSNHTTMPTANPTKSPTQNPTNPSSSENPTENPSSSPTIDPSQNSTINPTQSPSNNISSPTTYIPTVVGTYATNNNVHTIGSTIANKRDETVDTSIFGILKDNFIFVIFGIFAILFIIICILIIIVCALLRLSRKSKNIDCNHKNELEMIGQKRLRVRTVSNTEGFSGTKKTTHYHSTAQIDEEEKLEFEQVIVAIVDDESDHSDDIQTFKA